MNGKGDTPRPRLVSDEAWARSWERTFRSVELTRREAQIVALLLDGKSFKKIAAELKIQRPYVSRIVSRIARRINRPGKPLHIVIAYFAREQGRRDAA